MQQIRIHCSCRYYQTDTIKKILSNLLQLLVILAEEWRNLFIYIRLCNVFLGIADVHPTIHENYIKNAVDIPKQHLNRGR